MMMDQCRSRALFQGRCFIVRRCFLQRVIGRGERAMVSLQSSPRLRPTEQDYEPSLPIAARNCLRGVGDWYYVSWPVKRPKHDNFQLRSQSRQLKVRIHQYLHGSFSRLSRQLHAGSEVISSSSNHRNGATMMSNRISLFFDLVGPR